MALAIVPILLAASSALGGEIDENVQSETVFPSDLFLLDRNELIDLPAPLIPLGL